MPYYKLNYHYIFGTKDRRPRLRDDVWPGLCDAFHETIQRQGGELLACGGIEDHAHSLVSLPPSKTIAQSVRTLKSQSTLYLRNNHLGLEDFSWQGSYGVLSVYWEDVDTVVRYIQNQREHHNRGTTDDVFEIIEEPQH